jgi:dTDP-4-dehydrorhamnose 3,5-epimerase
MRVLIVGAGGQLGRSLTARLPDAVPLDRRALDVTDPGAVARLPWADVDAVVNAAAYTAVDRAETAAGRPSAWAVNATAVAHLARAAAEHRRTLVQVSSEYVFDGRHPGPMPEDLPLSPVSVYGAAKAAGELAATTCPAHYLVRSSWLVGDGPNFVRTMVRLAAQGVDPAVVDDQTGRPTLTGDLADGIVRLVENGAPYGTYHLTNTGEPASWAEVARTVFRLTGHDPARVRPVSTAEYTAGKDSAPRPANSVLDLSRAGKLGIAPPDWRDSLRAYLNEGLAQE